MKHLLWTIFALISFTAFGQTRAIRFENDTLYTSCGYKIYKGSVLHFGKGTLRGGKFRFVNIKSEASDETLNDNTVKVTKIKNFAYSSLNNAYIDIKGKITFKDGSKGTIEMHIAIEHAIAKFKGFEPELLVPIEFTPAKMSIADELAKLTKLYQEGVITKEEYESLKAKLISQ